MIFATIDMMECREANAQNVFRIHFTVNGQQHHTDLPNSGWNLGNPTLQFMAINNIRPADFGGTTTSEARLGQSDTPSDATTNTSFVVAVPVVHTGDTYELAASALSGGESALESAEWFGSDNDDNDDSDDTGGPHGGGSTDPSGGATRGHVDDGGDVVGPTQT